MAHGEPEWPRRHNVGCKALIVLLAGAAAVINKLLPAERRAGLRESLSRMSAQCKCPCHQAEAHECCAEEEEDKEPDVET
jgi:hypothetical protein